MREEIYTATDLAKRSTALVRHALEEPIAVVTPQGTVSMLNRERWLAVQRRSRIVEELFRAVSAARASLPAAAFPPSLRWVRLLPSDEVTRLVDQVTVTLDAIDDRRGTLDELADLLHEWAETARHVASREVGPALERG